MSEQVSKKQKTTDASSGAIGNVGASGISVPDPLDLPSLKGVVSDEEWRIRCELAAVYRLVALYGWDDMIFTHISVRLPDEDGTKRFLLNPYGVLFEEVTASSLIVVDVNGNLVRETPYICNAAGFTIHSALHMSRDNINCVLHLHTPFGVAVSAHKGGLRRYTQFAMGVINDLAYHDYEGIAFDLSERDRLIADLGEHSFMLLKNHGTLTTGTNCATAFMRMYFLERACQAQVYARSGIDAPLEEPEEMAAKVLQQNAPAFIQGLGDALAWPGLLRKLKRHNPGYDV